MCGGVWGCVGVCGDAGVRGGVCCAPGAAIKACFKKAIGWDPGFVIEVAVCEAFGDPAKAVDLVEATILDILPSRAPLAVAAIVAAIVAVAVILPACPRCRYRSLIISIVLPPRPVLPPCWP